MKAYVVLYNQYSGVHSWKTLVDSIWWDEKSAKAAAKSLTQGRVELVEFRDEVSLIKSLLPLQGKAKIMPLFQTKPRRSPYKKSTVTRKKATKKSAIRRKADDAAFIDSLASLEDDVYAG